MSVQEWLRVVTAVAFVFAGGGAGWVWWHLRVIRGYGWLLPAAVMAGLFGVTSLLSLWWNVGTGQSRNVIVTVYVVCQTLVNVHMWSRNKRLAAYRKSGGGYDG